MRTSTSLKAIVIIFLFSITPAQALDLAPQSEGPPLEVTLKWLKGKISAISETGKGEKVTNSEFAYDGKNFIFDQTYEVLGTLQRWKNVCNISDFENAGIHATDIHVRNSKSTCKRVDGIVGGSNCSDSKPQESFCYGYKSEYDWSAIIHNSDAELSEKIAKALNHAAKLINSMPKKRSDDLF